MSKKRTEIGVHNGQKYWLVYDRIGNQQAHGFHGNPWLWFLWIGCHNDNEDCYQGCFSLKRDAMATLPS